MTDSSIVWFTNGPSTFFVDVTLLNHDQSISSLLSKLWTDHKSLKVCYDVPLLRRLLPDGEGLCQRVCDLQVGRLYITCQLLHMLTPYATLLQIAYEIMRPTQQPSFFNANDSNANSKNTYDEDQCHLPMCRSDESAAETAHATPRSSKDVKTCRDLPGILEDYMGLPPGTCSSTVQDTALLVRYTLICWQTMCLQLHRRRVPAMQAAIQAVLHPHTR